MHRDLPNHMDACIQSHLLLALGRIQDQDSKILSLEQQLRALEHRSEEHWAQHKKAIDGVAVKAAAASTLVDALERRQTTLVQSEINKVDTKLSRKINEVAAQVQRGLQEHQRK